MSNVEFKFLAMPNVDFENEGFECQVGIEEAPGDPLPMRQGCKVQKKL